MTPPTILRFAALAILVGCSATETSLSMHEVKTPAAEGSRFPRVTLGGDGAIYISWLQRRAGREYALRFAKWSGASAFGEAKTVAEGSDWFVNWADFPSVVAAADGTLAAHWLQRLGAGRYAYGVRIACSRDGGSTWGEPFWVHQDRTATEHGFATLVPGAEGRFTAVWLDGSGLSSDRNMALRSVPFTADGVTGTENVLDQRVCECCATAAVRTQHDIVAFYRDRSDAEVRDIYRVRRGARGWGIPAPPYDDFWMKPG